DKPMVAMAFKIVEDPYGQLTFMRIYQGKMEKGGTYLNQRTGRKERFSRIVKMHADKREEVDEAKAGDIVAVMGVDCASGETYSETPGFCVLENIFVADPVIKMAINPLSRDGADKLGKALNRFSKEDPTFRIASDEETGETVIAGMGELHLEIYVERIRREYGVEVEVGAPKVSYRESAMQEAEYNFKHKKQSGGSGQFAHIVGKLAPITDETVEENYIFEENIVGGRIPKEYIPAVDKGFKAAMAKGPLGEFPIVKIHAILDDGSFHDVDSSEMAFQICARNCFRETFLKTKPVLLEPIMKMEIEIPPDFQGPVAGELSKRRGLVLSTDMQGESATIIAEVPLAETFGYSTDLRSMTQGQGTFSMEFCKYKQVPKPIQEKIIEDRKAEQLVGAK
ncbi:MAG: elongation factor G, partial [Pirellulales bacterium]|nr:elongation factor G [Pirellulales bacterium]